MTIHEAIDEIQHNNDLVFSHVRWWTREYIYCKAGKLYQEDDVEFDDELKGREILTCNYIPDSYYVRNKTDLVSKRFDTVLGD